jgi:hypothetical protein
MDFCFNELCLECKASDHYQADVWIRGLIDLLKQAHFIDQELPTLRTQSGFYSLPVGADFNIATWMNSDLADRTARSFLLTVKDRSPYLDSRLDQQKYIEATGMDFFYNNQRAIGLGSAWLLDGMAVSFPSAPQWICSSVVIKVETLDESGETQSENENVKHVSLTKHLEEHSSYFRSLDYYYQQVPNLLALQEKCKKLFSGLVFGNEAFDWMENTPLSRQQFRLIIRHLFNLNQFFCEQVPDGNINLMQIPNCSNESEATRRQYSDTRCFRFGVNSYYCEWHLKLQSLNVRIHFKPDFENKLAYVGYIGKHLKTALYS